MELSSNSTGIFVLLALGLLFGLKHATEVDHIVAVSTIVSQQRNVIRSALVGLFWGIGHTAALLIIGALVLGFRVAIPVTVNGWLEFGIAVMIITLGVSALRRSLRRGNTIHVHEHTHDGLSHAHVHFHEHQTLHNRQASSHSHAIAAVGIKPILIGTMHGLAGSGPLTLLILIQIQSSLIGMLYLAVFGIGSVAGMLLMSGLIGLPFVLTSKNLTAFHNHLQTASAIFSICFGIWYAYETGFSAPLL